MQRKKSKQLVEKSYSDHTQKVVGKITFVESLSLLRLSNMRPTNQYRRSLHMIYRTAAISNIRARQPECQ